MGRTVHSFVRHERVVPKWDRKRDSNVLQNHYRFEERNEEILLPISTHGTVLTKSALQDVYIEVDKRGELSISGVPATRAQLKAIVDVLAAQPPSPRFLLWMDYRCQPDARDAILSLATNISPEQTFFVVREDSGFDMNVVHKGLHYNRGIDPYRRRPRTAR